MLEFSKSNRIEYGLKKEGENFVFTCYFDEKNPLTLYILDMNDSPVCDVAMSEYKVSGRVYSVKISGLTLKEFKYYYKSDLGIVNDGYIFKHLNKREFGTKDSGDTNASESKVAYYCENNYDFSDDERPNIKHSDVIAYLLHVRGFTKHPSSKVKGKGCFLGIKEKIPYFSELGINQIEIMPAYDFYEFDKVNEFIAPPIPDYAINESKIDDLIASPNIPNTDKLNYWGYKAANYFCPKYEYSYSNDAVSEFKDMVKALHKAGIEIIMQMFYPKDVKTSVIIESLRLWYLEYHVDGFHIMGERLPVEMILSEELLYDAKIYINNLNRNDDYIAALSANRNVIDVNDSYMNSMRRYLKSDGDSLQGFVFYNRMNSMTYKSINYITKYEGFTLNDLVSYDHKHNEANGERNIDGTDYNFSWNCGVEGKSSKKTVKDLRIRQIKNALCLLLLSQGVPMLVMGDEMMNTQGGNNNPYCQDNEVTWLNWKLNKSSEEIYIFTKNLINYRRNHKVIHQDCELKNMDYLQSGSPDVSYHQDMAWKADLNNYLLHLGIMLDGAYGKNIDLNSNITSDDDTLYIAYNMHWENHLFGLPRLKHGMRWEFVLATCTKEESDEIIADLSKAQDEICIYKRSVVVLKAATDTVKEEK